jgi:hypothetical protein
LTGLLSGYHFQDTCTPITLANFSSINLVYLSLSHVFSLPLDCLIKPLLLLEETSFGSKPATSGGWRGGGRGASNRTRPRERERQRGRETSYDLGKEKEKTFESPLTS